MSVPEVFIDKNIPNLLKELEEAFYDIPFENSNFQNQMFVMADQITPARAYRAIGLKMFSKIRAVKEYKFTCEEQQIDLDEIEYKLSLDSTNVFDKRRLEIKKKKILDSKSWSEKLLNDAITELNFLYNEFKKFPKYTREDFENEEKQHFLLRLEKNSSINNDSIRSMLTIEKDFPNFELLRNEATKLLK